MLNCSSACTSTAFPALPVAVYGSCNNSVWGSGLRRHRHRHDCRRHSGCPRPVLLLLSAAQGLGRPPQPGRARLSRLLEGLPGKHAARGFSHWVMASAALQIWTSRAHYVRDSVSAIVHMLPFSWDTDGVRIHDVRGRHPSKVDCSGSQARYKCSPHSIGTHDATRGNILPQIPSNATL